MAELAIGAVAVLAVSGFLAYHRRKSMRKERRREIVKRLQAIGNS